MRIPVLATHWIPSNHPEMAQSIASITINFGIYEHQLGTLLERLRYCPPNNPAKPKKTLSDTIKSIESSARRAFSETPLEERIVGICSTANRLNARRNILIHGYFVRNSDGGFSLMHTNSSERVIYTVEHEDLLNLDSDISLANLDLSTFIMGANDPRIPNSHNNEVLARHFWQAHKISEMPHILPLRKQRFPSS